MGLKTAIEWTDATWNPWRGCSVDSPACEHCYAWTSSARNPGTLGFWGKNTPRVVMAESGWREPLAWDRKAAASGQPLKVFAWDLADWLEDHDGLCSLSASGSERGPRLWVNRDGTWDTDTREPGFGYNRRPLTLDDVRLRALDVIRQTPHLTWQLLTKRPQNWRPTLERLLKLIEQRGLSQSWEPHQMLVQWLNGFPPANAWIGATAEDQKQADRRIPKLLEIPARVRFLSMEPLLGPVDLREFIHCEGHCPVLFKDKTADGGLHYNACPITPDGQYRKLGWVIVGGESGPDARPCDLEWLRWVRDQCNVAEVPFFCKQLGSNPVWGPPLPGFGEPKAGRNESGWRMTADKKGGDPDEWPENLRVREWPEVKS
jgi:protein gp37